MFFLSFLSRGTSRDGTGQAVKIPSRPVPWQNFELVQLSLCPGTRKKFLSRCPEKLRCPVPLETLVQTKNQKHRQDILKLQRKMNGPSENIQKLQNWW